LINGSIWPPNYQTSRSSKIEAERARELVTLQSLTDVYQNVKLAYFTENHITNWKAEFSLRNEVISCNVLDKECKTGDEFNNLVSHYMTD
jgi:hypothetical protein